jgi:N-acyl-phosphatidylethanolamine-hydrolysing phospholipase D
MIPIGAYEPRWFMSEVHVDPDQAVQAFVDLQAAKMLPIHWGTFPLAEEGMMEPPKRMFEAASRSGLAADRFDSVEAGEPVEFYRTGRRYDERMPLGALP